MQSNEVYQVCQKNKQFYACFSTLKAAVDCFLPLVTSFDKETNTWQFNCRSCCQNQENPACYCSNYCTCQTKEEKISSIYIQHLEMNSNNMLGIFILIEDQLIYELTNEPYYLIQKKYEACENMNEILFANRVISLDDHILYQQWKTALHAYYVSMLADDQSQLLSTIETNSVHSNISDSSCDYNVLYGSDANYSECLIDEIEMDSPEPNDQEINGVESSISSNHSSNYYYNRDV